MIALRASELREIADMLAKESRIEQGRQVLSGSEFHREQARFRGGSVAR